ncbi:MAG: AAA family ATPase [Clostridia bacterium]|nr:AAA family ATPase [Clostridia bacterium]
MSEEKTQSRYGELKHRLKSRIPQQMFDAMPVEIRNFLLDMPQEDIKEALLNVITRIPWEAGLTVPEINLRRAKALLDRSHYGMEDVKEKVMRYLSCQKHLGKSHGAVLLLVGAPGVGKTSIAAAIAAAMGRPCVKISLAGVSDAYFLRGVHTVYHNARPGRIVEAISRSHSFCPVILLDEIDKMGASHEHGCPENVLLDLLDGDRSKFVDNFLNVPLDLSNVVFIATANHLKPIAPVLRDRMDIVELPSYAATDKKKIVQGYVWPKLTREYQLDSLDKLHDPCDDFVVVTQGLELCDDAVEELIHRCPEEGVRDLERYCRTLCESVIALYYAERVLVKNIDVKLLDMLLEPIFYKKS